MSEGSLVRQQHARYRAARAGIGIGGWLAVLVILALVDAAVRNVFVPVWLTRIGDVEGEVLHDVTLGRNLAVVFTLAERKVAVAPRSITVVGDSTIMGDLFGARDARLAPVLERRLAASEGALGTVAVVELGFLGLTTPDAAIVVAKSLAMDVDLVTYAMTPRIMCALPAEATDAHRYVLDPDVAARLGPRLLGDYPLATLAGSAVRSHWALLTFQNEIRDQLAHAASRRLPEPWRGYVAPVPYAASLGGEAAPLTGPMWTNARCRLDDDSRAVVALRHILDMCAAERRCFPYHGPINPDALGSFDADLLPRFRALVARLTAERGIPYRDYADDLPATVFRRQTVGRPDAIHLEASGRAWLAERLATDVGPLLAHQRSRPGRP